MAVYDVIIMGAGISGLTCAWSLVEKGYRVLVLETSSRPGGNVWTEEHNGYRYEYGPHSFMASAHSVFDLASQIGLDSEIIPTFTNASRRYIVRDKRLHLAPMNWSSFLTTGLLTWKGKLSLMAEPIRTSRGQPSDTALQFFERRFGKEGAKMLAGAFISGIYAGDPASLSAPAAFPLFWKFEQESGGMIRGAWKHLRKKRAERKKHGEPKPAKKGLYSFRNGMGQLSQALASRLEDRIAFNCKVQSIIREAHGYDIVVDDRRIQAKHLVLATPPAEAGRLLAFLNQELSELITTIPMAPVATVHMGFESQLEEIPNGFGFLSPRNQGIRSLGVLFPSRIFANRAPGQGDLLVGFVGGMLDESALELSDQGILELVLRDLEVLVGLKRQPDFVRIRRVSKAIPQFLLGHLQRMEKAQVRISQYPGLYLAGNYCKGVGIKDAIASGSEIAKEIANKTSNN